VSLLSSSYSTEVKCRWESRLARRVGPSKLGIALEAMGERESGTACLMEAVSVFQEAQLGNAETHPELGYHLTDVYVHFYSTSQHHGGLSRGGEGAP
jgi:hypothetical protein